MRTFALAVLLAAPVAVIAQGRGTEPRDPMQELLPLKPSRTVSFGTDVGHWMSVDVSPDGQTLVFDLLGDIYMMPITGGRARALTRGMGIDVQPRFSPDGKRIVFVSDRDGGWNLWLLSLDKRDTVQLTRGKTRNYQAPAFTPDGNYVVVSRDQGLWIYHVAGGAGQQLFAPATPPANTGGGAYRHTSPAVSPDGRYVWYTRRRGEWNYNSPLRDYELFSYDRRTGQVSSRESRWGSALRPTLSPDGKWLVYGTRYLDHTRLRIRDLDSGEERWLVYPVNRDDQESRAALDPLPGMSFTPDSRFLVASWEGKLWKVPVNGGAAQHIPMQADVVQAMAAPLRFAYPISDSTTFVVKQVRDGALSPDGRRLAFVALDRLYAMDYPNGVPRRLTSGTSIESRPVWTPDGRSILYITWSNTDGGGIHSVAASGSGVPTKLAGSASTFWSGLSISPDARRIVAIRGPARAVRERSGGAGASEIVWIPSGGGAETLIAPAGDMSNAHFTARDSSARIYFSTGGGLLVSMRWDGMDVRQHLQVPGAQWVQVSPTNYEVALARIGMDLYRVTIPEIGGAAPTISVANPAGATFPVKKLTDIGAQFPSWAPDGRSAHWSIGNAHVVQAGDSGKPVESRIRVLGERDVPRGSAVLRGARAITMKGNEVIENADIVVVNNRIAGVGRRGSVPIPAGARVVDLRGKTVVPGFVDTHAHPAPGAVHRDPVWSYLANLAYGVTTMRDPSTGTTDVFSYEDQVTSGKLIGPRIYSTGPTVFGADTLRSLDHTRTVLKRYSDYYDTKTIKEYTIANREQRQWIAQAAGELRLMPTNEGNLDVRKTISEMIDGYSGHEHTITTFPLQSDFIRLLKESGMVYTPTAIVSFAAPFAENYWYQSMDLLNDEKLNRFTPWTYLEDRILRRGAANVTSSSVTAAGWFHESQYVMDLIGASVRDLVAAGGRAGIGSHGQLNGLCYHWEMWTLARGGISPHDLLRVATLMGADAIGLAGDIGSIEPGKMADLLILDANPLTDIRNTNSIRMVMKNGRLYDGNTLDETYPRQLKAGPFPWEQNQTPVAGRGTAQVPAQESGATDARLAALADSLLRLPATTSGIMTLNVTGTPAAPGALYEMMIRIDSAKWIAPHTHNVEKRIRVLRGALLVGHGNAVDATKVERHAAGATLKMPANHAHFEGAGAATIIVLDARGPFTTTFVGR